MSQKAKEGGKGGLFSFRENLAKMGDLRPRIRELERQLAELPQGRESRSERKRIQRELDNLRAQSKRAFLKVLGGGGAIAGAAPLLVVQLFWQAGNRLKKELTLEK